MKKEELIGVVRNFGGLFVEVVIPDPDGDSEFQVLKQVLEPYRGQMVRITIEALDVKEKEAWLENLSKQYVMDEYLSAEERERWLEAVRLKYWQ